MAKYVAYYRKSKGGNLTQTQLRNSLGIESQKNIVKKFLRPDDELIGEFEDMETGKKNNRPEFLKALKLCKETNSELLIAKLDRMSRNASFILNLRDSGVKFTCCDMPKANSLTIGIMAILAQDEREKTSVRTKEALAVLKSRGVKLGNPYKKGDIKKDGSIAKAPFGGSGLVLAIESNIKRAKENENNCRAKAMAESLRNVGKTFGYIAERLNESGFKASQGGLFNATQIRRLLVRVA